MAQVAPNPQNQPDIDYHLDYQFAGWESLPEEAECWPERDLTEKEVFQLEWERIMEDRLADLQRWAVAGLLTTAQLARYKKLVRLVEKQRPVLERMLRD